MPMSLLMSRALGVIGALLSPCVWASQVSLELLLPEGARLSLSIGDSQVEARLKNRTSSRASIDRPLRVLLLQADEVIPLSSVGFQMDSEIGFTLIARLPSRSSNPDGFCGAGHEDYLLLIGVRDKRLSLLDKHLIQSCLKSISLQSDQGDDPRAAIIPLPYPNVAAFETVTAVDPVATPQCVQIQQRTLVMGSGCQQDFPAPTGKKP